MKVLFLHGLESKPGGAKVKHLLALGHTVFNPALPKNDFDESVRIAQADVDKHQPDVIVGSSRGGAVAMAVDRAGGAELSQQVGEAVLRLPVPVGKARLSARWFSAILSRHLSPSWGGKARQRSRTAANTRKPGGTITR